MRRVPNLDILRIIAAVMVIITHTVLRHQIQLGTLVNMGGYGVTLFFVLSGYLISNLLFNEIDKYNTINIKNFLIRRGLKLYPPYYVFLAFSILYPALKAYQKNSDWLTTLKHRFDLAIPNFLFLNNYLGNNAWKHTWSLAVEEHFYILLPFLIVYLYHKNKSLRFIPNLFIIFTIFCAIIRYCHVEFWQSNASYTYITSHCRFDALFTGVFIQYCFRHYYEKLTIFRKHPIITITIGIVLYFIVISGSLKHITFDHIPLTNTIKYLTLTTSCSLVLIGSLFFKINNQHISSIIRIPTNLLAKAGIYSYSIYLWHVEIICHTDTYLSPYITKYLNSYYNITIILTSIITCVTAGILLSLIIETPILFLRDKFWPSRSN